MKKRDRPKPRPAGRPAPRPAGQRPQAGRPKSAQARTVAELPAGRWVIGLHSCEEALRVRASAVSHALLRPDWERATHLHEIKARLDRARVPITTTSMDRLDALGSGHQGLALCLSDTPVLDWKKLESADSALVVIVDGLEDPQNLGALLRTCWLTGVDAVIAPEDRAVGLTPAACKVASGGAEHVPVVFTPSLLAPMQRLKDLGFWIYGLAEGGKSHPWDIQLPRKTAWVVGSESSGLRINTERACDELVRIPQAVGGSSYNASVAVAMALMETSRQLGIPKGQSK